MGEKRIYNWYEELELSFDPPVEDEAVIEKRINEKSVEWSKLSTTSSDKKYGILGDMIDDIKKDMLGEANIRKDLAKEAKDKRNESIDVYLDAISGKQYIKQSEINSIVSRLKMDKDVIINRIKERNIPIEEGEDNSDYQDIYDKYYKKRSASDRKFRGISKTLQSLNKETLYEFLYDDPIAAKDLPAQTLLARAKERKEKEFFKTDRISAIGSDLCSSCQEVFENENTKAEYDDYLDTDRLKNILKDFKKQAEVIEGPVPNSTIDSVVNSLGGLLKDPILAKDIVEAFYKVEKISVIGGDDKEKNPNLKYCRCGHLNDTSDGRKFCSSCGLELDLKCPKCGKLNPNTVNTCSCGFDLSKIDRVKSLTKFAEEDLNKLDFISAEAKLSQAESYWKNNDKVQKLKARLSTEKSKVDSQLDKLNVFIKDKYFYQARDMYRLLKKSYPNFDQPLIKDQIEKAIKAAESKINLAKSAKDKDLSIKYGLEANDICRDIPSLSDILPAPDMVTGLKVKTDPIQKQNIISWDRSNDRSIVFRLYRSDSIWIRNPEDGELIYEGSSFSFTDKKIKPGELYYYNVFASRASLLSKPGPGISIRNLFDVTNLKAQAQDGTVKLSWDGNFPNTKAVISEYLENGSEKVLGETDRTSFLARSLQNNKTYSFVVRLAYNIDGKIEKSQGLRISAIPTVPIDPINSLTIRPYKDGTYQALFYHDSMDPIRLYGSTKRMDYNIGDTISLDTIENEMDPIETRALPGELKLNLYSGQKGFVFDYKDDVPIYVVALAIRNQNASFGNICKIRKGEDVKIKDVRIVNDRVTIFIDPVKNASGYLLLYNFDHPVFDIEDRSCQRTTISLGQFERDKAIFIENPQDRKYYIGLFAQFKEDSQIDYSAVSDYEFDNQAKVNISYEIKLEKSLFGKVKAAKIIFKADQKDFSLPAIEIRSQIGVAPIFKESAELLDTVEPREISGTYEHRIPATMFGKNTYIKPFLKNDRDNSKYQLQIDLGSSLKIS
uniref:zinc ribbon domain-containing protein n=1 Tax=Anaerococcus mediterraneensis TaxID=1870984 RepID=UPI0009301A5D|nr:zinc ribbon domain-containing protein [Anaerococcus mediterraneensis]